MSEKHFVVQGAICQCKFSVDPQKKDELKVKTHSKHYANDKDGKEKLIATDKEIGQPFKKNTFGKCDKQPTGSGDYFPCRPIIKKWSGVHKNMTLSNQGKPLLEDSKASCQFGGKDCVIIKDHGQVTEPGEQNFKNAEPTIHNLINPMVDVRDMYKKQPEHKGLDDSSN